MTHDYGLFVAPRSSAPVRSALAIACTCAAVAMVTACTRAEDKPLPADPKARSEFIDAQSATLSEENRKLLNRFLARVKAQEAAGGASPAVSVAKAVALQRAYDGDVLQAQRNYQKQLTAANADVRADMREQALVKEGPGKPVAAKSATGKAATGKPATGKSDTGITFRYVVDVTNTSKRVIDRIVLRIDFRDAAGKYVVSVPALELKGPLAPGGAGRTTQTMALNPRYHAYLIEGHPAQVTAVATRIVYADGETIDAAAELKKLETLSRSKIE
jgi:hypothetical protein